MKHTFKKILLPEIDKLSKQDTTGRTFWNLARIYQKQDGLTYNPTSVLMLLQQGAYRNDPWSMCELARFYYNSCIPENLPLALSWWRKAVVFHDQGTLADLCTRDICSRIENLHMPAASEYANIEMQCTLYAEWILTDMGRSDWNSMLFSEQQRRVVKLIKTTSKLLYIKEPQLITDAALLCNGHPCDGYASPGSQQLGIREGVFHNYERLIQVLFHELGHFVIFSMWNTSVPGIDSQMRRFGITHERIKAWHQDKKGMNLACTEEDADTLSYGVYTNWVILFKQQS